MTELEQNIESYAKLQEEEAALSEKMNTLKEAIMTEMRAQGSDKVISGNITAQIIRKETYKYVDELAMVKWCKANGYSNFIQEKIITTAMNKELKKGLSLNESLNNMYNKVVTESFKVEAK